MGARMKFRTFAKFRRYLMWKLTGIWLAKERRASMVPPAWEVAPQKATGKALTGRTARVFRYS